MSYAYISRLSFLISNQYHLITIYKCIFSNYGKTSFCLKILQKMHGEFKNLQQCETENISRPDFFIFVKIWMPKKGSIRSFFRYLWNSTAAFFKFWKYALGCNFFVSLFYINVEFNSTENGTFAKYIPFAR